MIWNWEICWKLCRDQIFDIAWGVILTFRLRKLLNRPINLCAHVACAHLALLLIYNKQLPISTHLCLHSWTFLVYILHIIFWSVRPSSLCPWLTFFHFFSFRYASYSKETFWGLMPQHVWSSGACCVLALPVACIYLILLLFPPGGEQKGRQPVP